MHHPLCLEAGLSKARQDALYALEKAALALARRIVVTSRITARTLVSDFAVPGGKITIAEPGTDPAPAQPARGPLQLLSVGAIAAQGCDLLVRALAPLKDRAWRLTLVGRPPQPGSAGSAAYEP